MGIHWPIYLRLQAAQLSILFDWFTLYNKKGASDFITYTHQSGNANRP